MAVVNGNYSVLDHGFTLNGLALIVLSPNPKNVYNDNQVSHGCNLQKDHTVNRWFLYNIDIY